MSSEIELLNHSISKPSDPLKKANLGQFFTPLSIAEFMVGMFTRKVLNNCRLLDSGAGAGMLTSIFLENCISGSFDFGCIEVDAFEIDQNLIEDLTETLIQYDLFDCIKLNIRNEDFIYAAVESLNDSLFNNLRANYSHAILNPPYKKIKSNSIYRSMLSGIGLETVNLYSAFVALSLSLLESKGQLVAIIPRSFCNGPYYRPFRKFVLKNSAIKHIHLFHSRNSAFKDDNVLQENIIILLEKDENQGDVIISTSHDNLFEDIQFDTYEFEQIVFPEDQESFVHIPTSKDQGRIELLNAVQTDLNDLGINVSTGPVVDYRIKEHLKSLHEKGTVPLIYPIHFDGLYANWPKEKIKKANAIDYCETTKKWLYPNGFYCVVRRFSSKEEKRRVIASVVRPEDFPEVEMLGFENHLNVFHRCKQGLPESIAYGITAFLNTTIVDDYFRRFNGHTQVNATDLRLIKYPSLSVLTRLGQWAKECGVYNQIVLDDMFDELVMQ